MSRNENTGSGNAGHEPAFILTPDNYTRVMTRLPQGQQIGLARAYGRKAGAAGLKPEEKSLVAGVLRLVAKEAEAAVRRALSEALAHNPGVPRDLALALANDEELVAAPMLEASDVLTSEDLLAIIETQRSQAKMCAIAKRRDVSGRVSEALARHGDRDVMLTLLGNSSAAISESAYHLMLDRQGDDVAVQEQMIARSVLPRIVVARMIDLVSKHLVQRIVERHHVPADTAVRLAVETKERATIGLATGLSASARDNLIADLLAEGRITPSLLLRSVSTGNLEFFTHSLAALAAVSPDYVTRRLLSESERDMDEIWAGTSLPKNMLPVVKAAVKVMKQTQIDGAKWDVDTYRARIIERILTEYDVLGVELGDDDADYVFAEREKTVLGGGVHDFYGSALAPAA